jgi:AcrR family transcriptional regulator
MNETNVLHAPRSATATKDRILAAAEHLFANSGFEATSLRDITTAAGVNLAAVNYHFRSKDDLIRAVFERRLRPINQARLERLRGYMETVGSGPVELEPVFRAFLEPVVALHADSAGRDLGRLLGRTYVETSSPARQVFLDLMREVARPFTDAFRSALPGVDQVELLWKIHFSIGAMAHTMAGTEHLKFISGGLCNPAATDELIEHLVAFLAAGVRAPVARHANRSRTHG